MNKSGTWTKSVFAIFTVWGHIFLNADFHLSLRLTIAKYHSETERSNLAKTNIHQIKFANLVSQRQVVVDTAHMPFELKGDRLPVPPLTM